ncbi:phage tail tape measure protein [Acinetobacter sichuanensis]|uniref:phage tail tape measure protein n=1 Tax=Acinetobacter sichuanensis TaxID=2136183 RepID=UPI00280E9335|nr:phage tail tape measure protein [Acinetobacter sichuanensis]MDQ9023175.1 phage tail tape measure protein [Acinetobacter sichuanensis]
MAQAGVIRDFMVALGFKTDNSGLEKMQGAMEGVELKATALKGALMALATGAVIAVRQTASELDKLYFSSQRIGASVSNINAYGNAITQLGGSAEEAVGTLESLAEKMRNSPGYESQIKSLGVDTRDANGEMRDRVEMMKDLSGVLAKMPAYQANAYASSLGIDQNTLLAMRDGKFMANMEKYQKIQKELGMSDELAKSGNEFMTEYRDLTMMTKTGFQVIVMQAGKALIPVLRLLNQLIQAGIHAFSQLNPQIKEGLAVALRFGMLAIIFGAFFKTFGVLLKIIPLLKIFIGLLKMMRLAFLASPIGIILALASALALLYDDYKTWRDGGKSLFDWSKWTNGIDTIINKIKDFLKMLDEIKDKVINFVQKVISDPVEAVKEVAEIAADEAKNLAQKGADALNDKIAETDTGKKILDKVGEGTAKVSAFFGNEEAQNAVKTNKGKPATTLSDITKKGVEVLVGTAKVVQNEVKGVANRSGKKLALSEEDIVRIMKVTATEVVPSLKGKNFENQASGIIDTILNRTASGHFGGTVKDVVNQRWAFSDINTSRKSAYGSVDRVPMKRVSKRVEDFVRRYLDERASGKVSSVGDNISYANPNFLGEASLSTKKWVREVEKQAKSSGQIYGAGKAIHVHGTPLADVWKKPKAYYITTPSSKANQTTWLETPKDAKALANFAQNADLPTVNPHKAQVNNSNLQSRSVVIHQSYKTDMSISGTASPLETANAVKRQQENSMVFMSRSAQGVLG